MGTTSIRSESDFNQHVQVIKELVAQGISEVPADYVLPLAERPCISQVSDTENIPVVDLAGLHGADSRQVIQEIGQACREWGFLQVVNHGVPRPVLQRMWVAAQKFFELPAEERIRFYLEDPRSLPASSKTAGSISSWRETLRFRGVLNPSDNAPAICREPVLEYSREMKLLAFKIYEAILESLGVSADLEKANVSKSGLSLHCYPPCPDPSLTLGIRGHSDISTLTILLQDQVGGLEVLKDDRWVVFKPVKDSLAINIGEQLERLTNGKYRSIRHRVVTNIEKSRMSIASFFVPPPDARIAPLKQLIDSNNPPRYKDITFGDRFQEYSKQHVITVNDCYN